MGRGRSSPNALPQLAPAELEVMKVVWGGGRLSAREIHDKLGARTAWAYSTSRTVVERMVAKGLLERERFHGLNLYRAAISRPAGLAALVRSFAEDVLELRRVPVAALFAESDVLTPEEMEELRALLGEGAGARRAKGAR
jgi:predicted transcriptional regulator